MLMQQIGSIRAVIKGRGPAILSRYCKHDTHDGYFHRK